MQKMMLVVGLFLLGAGGIVLLQIVRRARSGRQLDHTLGALRSLGERIELTSEVFDGTARSRRLTAGGADDLD